MFEKVEKQPRLILMLKACEMHCLFVERGKTDGVDHFLDTQFDPPGQTVQLIFTRYFGHLSPFGPVSLECRSAKQHRSVVSKDIGVDSIGDSVIEVYSSDFHTFIEHLLVGNYYQMGLA